MGNWIGCEGGAWLHRTDDGPMSEFRNWLPQYYRFLYGVLEELDAQLNEDGNVDRTPDIHDVLTDAAGLVEELAHPDTNTRELYSAALRLATTAASVAVDASGKSRKLYRTTVVPRGYSPSSFVEPFRGTEAEEAASMLVGVNLQATVDPSRDLVRVHAPDGTVWTVPTHRVREIG